MYRKLAVPCVVTLILLLITSPVLAAPNAEPLAEGPDVRGKAAAVVDVGTGLLLQSVNGTQHLPMASTTKIMTALIAIERGDLDDIVTIPAIAAGVEGSKIFLEKGETYTLRELLYALMLESANDAARAIAVHFGGTLEGFATIMNERAEQLGLADTHFSNPTGLNDSDHYTSAVDLATLAAYALHNPTFREIVSTTGIDISYPVKQSTRHLRNHNYLLTSYPGATGVKTGYTTLAGFCLVGSAKNESGREVVAVILGSSSAYVYRDISILLSWGLVHFEELKGADSDTRYVFGEVPDGTSELSAHPTAPVSLLVERNQESSYQPHVTWDEGLKAPIAAGQAVGVLEYTKDGQLVATQPLLAISAVERVHVGPPWWLAAIVPAGFIMLRYFKWRIDVGQRVRKRRRTVVTG